MTHARFDMQDTMLELGLLPDYEPSRRPHGKVLQKALEERDPVRWNEWRRKHGRERLDLRKIVLKGKYLGGLDLGNCLLDDAELERTDLRSANLRGSSFRHTNLALSNLSGARCDGAYFLRTNAFGAQAIGATLKKATFRDAKLECANLTDADLSHATLVRTNLEGARLDRALMHHTTLRSCNLSHTSLADSDLEGAKILGCSAPYVNAKRVRIGENVEQRNLFLGHTVRAVSGGLYSRPITADDLRMASFLGELERPDCLTHLINAGNDYLVLILGRFSRPARQVLRTLERNVWQRGRIPLVFDFQGPGQRKLVDAVRFFACLAQFVIVDLSDPRSVPFELQAVVPQLAVPLVPLIRRGREPFAMFADLSQTYPWVLPVFSYTNPRQIDRFFDDVLRLVESVHAGVALRGRKPATVLPLYRAKAAVAETTERDAPQGMRRKREKDTPARAYRRRRTW